MRRPLLLLALVLTAVFVASCGSAAKAPATPDAPSLADVEDVHPCIQAADPLGIKPSLLQATAQPNAPSPVPAVATPTAVPTVAATDQTGCTAPDFSQKCALWGNDEYDHANSQDVGCGKTMAQCGCALTAAASLLVRYGITRGPDGQPTNPKTLNDWMKADAKTTASGTVSRGYVYGMVSWVAIAQYSQLAAQKFGTPALTYAGNLAADLGALRKELDAKRPVILEQPGHFVLATGDVANTVSIDDPYYPERKLLDVPSYKNRFISGRLYRPGNNAAAVVVVAPKGVQFTLKDPSGKTTGFLNQQPIAEVRQSVLSREPMWRDPTCTTGDPIDDVGVTEAYVSAPGDGRWTIDITSAPPDKAYSITMLAYDKDGTRTAVSVDGKGSDGWTMDYKAAAGTVEKIQPKAASPSPTPSPATNAPSPTGTPSRTTTPTATATPTANGTVTPTPGPTASVTLSLNPTTVDCSKTNSFTTVTVTVRDAAGRPAAPATVVLSSARQPGANDNQVGMFSSATLTNVSGSATSRYFPTTGTQGGTNTPNKRVINARVQGDTGRSFIAEATLTCGAP